MPPPPFQMMRARTQLQINMQPPMTKLVNLSRNFGSNMDLKTQDVRSLDRSKLREVKKPKAPLPPVAKNKVMKVVYI